MMVRNVNFTYRNQYSMSLPGYAKSVGDVFGQNMVDTNGEDALAPGLGFAFGFVGDDYVVKAKENNWLIDTHTTTPASTNKVEDFNLRLTLEPARNLRIDLNASRTMTTNKSMQFMYGDATSFPISYSGQFTMTTVSIKSAFEGMGSAENGFHSASFERFCNSLDGFRSRVEAQYAGLTYPNGMGEKSRKPFNPNEYAGVNKYSADVMVPAFLSTYAGTDGLSIFPALTKMLPNWMCSVPCPQRKPPTAGRRIASSIQIPFRRNQLRRRRLHHRMSRR